MPTVAEVRTYVDSEGRRVLEFIEVFGKEKDKGKATYKGQGMMMARTPDPRVPVRQIPFEFDFPEGTTLKDAFKGFDKLAQDKVADFQAKQKIVGARTMPMIMGPDGKPMNVGA